MSEPAMLPRWDDALAKYVWEAPAEPTPAVEPPAPSPSPSEDVAPAFVVEALDRKFDPDLPRTITFQDSYPFVGTPLVDSAPEPEFDELAEFRVAPHVADRLLAGLPLDTPRFLRALLTLLLGAARADRF